LQARDDQNDRLIQVAAWKNLRIGIPFPLKWIGDERCDREVIHQPIAVEYTDGEITYPL
jgi:hypothetical protein